MAKEPTIYDLVLLLSESSTDEERAKILSEVESAIASSGGSIERNQDWGRRPLTYQINHQGEAEYHLLQFQGPTTLLDSLSHSLRIADPVLRFRIIKVTPGTPPAPDSAPPLVAPAGAAPPPTAAVTAGAPAAATTAAPEDDPGDDPES
jgi:small subunit ribosomal protein S6